jgi:hypothetical protein
MSSESIDPLPALPQVKPCANCGAPMHGPYCYACGQPEKGTIRHLASVLADIGDTIFNVDSRIFRSILPLYFRPGYLTTEYFAGRRVRYVSPFRLFFFLCVIAFFAVQIDLRGMHFNIVGPEGELGSKSIENARTEAEVAERLAQAIKGVEEAKSTPAMPAEVVKRLTQSEAKVREQATRRIAWLRARDAAVGKGEAPPPDPNEEESGIRFFGINLEHGAPPIRLAWLPAFANDMLNETTARAIENAKLAKRDPARLIVGMVAMLPQTLFVMMPLFALLLKIVYIFKRRLYMEHLIVALHSHAFIFQSILVLLLLGAIKGWVAAHAAPLATVVTALTIAAWAWIPVYLFVMQKRVYRHGWFMAVVMYGLVGFCYSNLIGFALLGAVLASLAFT